METLIKVLERAGYIIGVLITVSAVLASPPANSTGAPTAKIADKSQIDQWIKEAEQLVPQKPREAERYVERKIQACGEWKGADPNQIKQGQMLMSGLYYELGRARTAAGDPVEKVLPAYTEAIKTPSTLYLAEQAWVLGWICDKIIYTQYLATLARFRQQLSKQDFRTLLVNTVKNIVTERPDAIPRAFTFDYINPAHEDAEDPVAFAKAMQGALGENETVKTEFLEWCRRKKNLVPFVLERDIENADKLFGLGIYDKALDVYRSILKRTTRVEDYAKYQLKLCQCLLGTGEYEKAISELDNMMGKVREVKGLSDQAVPEALLLKGQCFFRMGDMAKMKSSCDSLLKDYPKSARVPVARLLIGYSKIKTGNIDEAKNALTLLVKECPDTSSCYQAKLYLEALTRVEKK